MATVRVYGTPESRANQTAFWANYYPNQQRANAQFDLSAWASAQDNEARQRSMDDAAEVRARDDEYRRLHLFAVENAQQRAAAENLRRFNIDLDFGQKAEVENLRRFNIEAGIKQASVGANLANTELKKTAQLRNDILAGKFQSPEEVEPFVNPANVPNVLKWFQQAEDDRLQAQLETLNAETARVQAKQLAAKMPVNIDAQTADLIARSLSDKIGRISPKIRWDGSLGEWTTDNGFDPVMGQFRQSEGLSRFAAPAPILQPPSASQNDLVAVFNPAGQPVKIRRSQLTEAMSRGYRLR